MAPSLELGGGWKRWFNFPPVFSSQALSAPALSVPCSAASNTIIASTFFSHLPNFFSSFLITDFAARRGRQRSAAIKATRHEAVTQFAQGDLPAKAVLQRVGVQAKQQRHRGMQIGVK